MKRPPARKPRPPADAWAAAAAYGCDMALLEDSLAMSPAQRIHAHRNALALIEKLEAAAQEAHDRSRKPAQTTRRSSH